jgi:hypothetical protein
VNFAFGSDGLKIISFRAPENDVACYGKHNRHRRASDYFRASVSGEANAERENAAK